MISVIKPEMASKLLEPPKSETEDDKELNQNWVKIFVIGGVLFVCSVVSCIEQAITDGRFVAMTGAISVFILVFLLYVLIKYITAKVLIPKRFFWSCPGIICSALMSLFTRFPRSAK